MSQLLSLSRAARLVGVNRHDLQRKIQVGELDSFDGMVSIDSLLSAFPGAQLEDNTEYSRVQFIKERAFGKRVFERVMPDVETLAVRLKELGTELMLSKSQNEHYKMMVDRLREQIVTYGREASIEVKQALDALKCWLDVEVVAVLEPDYPNPLAVRNQMLRVLSALVTVQPSGQDFFIDGPDTILEAALRAGIPLNYGCSGGNCGLCRAKLVSGEIRKTRFHDYVRTEADKRDNMFLMCSNTAVTDIVIEASVAGGVQDIPFQQIAATVKVITPLNEDMTLLHLQTPRTNRLRFLAGQSATLILSKSLKAELPIASCPCDDRNILFHVKRMPGNLFSDYVFERLRKNEVVDIEGPQGEFILHEKSERALFFFAFDTGFAPIKSLIEHAMSLETFSAIHLYWIGAHENSLYMPNVGRAWADALDNFHFKTIVANYELDHLPDNRALKMLDMFDEITQAHPEIVDSDIYIAGPHAASAFAEQIFLGMGLPKSRVFVAD